MKLVCLLASFTLLILTNSKDGHGCASQNPYDGKSPEAKRMIWKLRQTKKVMEVRNEAIKLRKQLMSAEAYLTNLEVDLYNIPDLHDGNFNHTYCGIYYLLGLPDVDLVKCDSVWGYGHQ